MPPTHKLDKTVDRRDLCFFWFKGQPMERERERPFNILSNKKNRKQALPSLSFFPAGRSPVTCCRVCLCHLLGEEAEAREGGGTGDVQRARHQLHPDGLLPSGDPHWTPPRPTVDHHCRAGAAGVTAAGRRRQERSWRGDTAAARLRQHDRPTGLAATLPQARRHVESFQARPIAPPQRPAVDPPTTTKFRQRYVCSAFHPLSIMCILVAFVHSLLTFYFSMHLRCHFFWRYSVVLFPSDCWSVLSNRLTFI